LITFAIIFSLWQAKIPATCNGYLIQLSPSDFPEIKKYLWKYCRITARSKSKAYKTNQPLVNRSGNFGISGIYFLICGNKYTPLLSKFSSIILY